MHCLRLARAYTGRSKILKFEGNFHGYHDQIMFAIGTPPDHLGPEESPRPHPGSTGLPPGLADNLVLLPYNWPDLLEETFDQHGDQQAAAILEPVYYNAGCVPPTEDFLATLYCLTREHGVLLIFDEVLSAFRMAPGGAQEFLGVTLDLCTLGKAVGGGFPLSVFGGKAHIMERLMPTGDCQHSGTNNGHPVPVVASWPTPPPPTGPAIRLPDHLPAWVSSRRLRTRGRRLAAVRQSGEPGSSKGEPP